MTGFIKVENVVKEGREGLCVECQLSKVTAMDKFHMLHCVCRALNIRREDLAVFSELEKLQLWEEPEDVEDRRPGVVEEILDTIFGGHDEG